MNHSGKRSGKHSGKRIAITGIDLTGKTTLIHDLQRRENSETRYHAYRCPHYHEDPQIDFGVLSKTIMDLGHLADQEKDGLLKASTLFLGMTLYGDAERHFERTRPNVSLICERHPMVDSLAYASIYRPLLNQLRDQTLPKSRRDFPGIEAVDHLLTRIAPGFSLQTFPHFLRDLFNQERELLMNSLKRLCQTDLPDMVVLLTASPSVIAERLALRGGAREYHESESSLATLQEAFRKSCQFLAQSNPTLKLLELPTGRLSPEACTRAILKELGEELDPLIS